MLSVPRKALVYLCTGVLLCGCPVTSENQDGWEVAVVDDLEAFYEEGAPPAESAGSGSSSGSGSGSLAGITSDGIGARVDAGGGKDFRRGSKAPSFLSCAQVAGRPGETAFQCELDVTGLAEEAELPAEATLWLTLPQSQIKLRVPIAYVEEAESFVGFVFLLENQQVAESHSLTVAVTDDRGLHSTELKLTAALGQATAGLTTDQLGGVR